MNKLANSELHELLLWAIGEKDPEHYWCSKGFDWDIAFQRVKGVVPCIESIVKHKLVAEPQNEDMYSFAVVFDPRPTELTSAYSNVDVTIEFSAYVNLAGIRTRTGDKPMPRRYFNPIASCLRTAGFIPVNADLLQTMQYDGPEISFRDDSSTWYDRFFGYT